MNPEGLHRAQGPRPPWTEGHDLHPRLRQRDSLIADLWRKVGAAGVEVMAKPLKSNPLVDLTNPKATPSDTQFRGTRSIIDAGTGPTDTESDSPASQAHRDRVARIRASTKSLLQNP